MMGGSRFLSHRAGPNHPEPENTLRNGQTLVIVRTEYDYRHSFKPALRCRRILGSMKTLDLLRDAVHLGASSKALPVLDFGHDYDKYLAEFCSESDPGRLVCLYESRSDWAAWEAHPSGDELVLVLSGKAEFLQEVNGKEHRTIVEPYQAIINPPGVWHTANVIEPFLALFVTPGPGTTHRPR